jgi:HEAT repeat protein
MTTPSAGDEPSLSSQTPPTGDPGLGGEAALLHAVEALDDPDPKIHDRAAIILAEHGDVRAFDLLVGLLNKHSHVTQAIRLLGKLKDPRATPILIQWLQDRQDHYSRIEIQTAALNAIGDSGDQGAIDDVKQFLLANMRLTQRYRRRVSQLAVQTLKRLGDDQLQGELIDLAQTGFAPAIALLGFLKTPEAVPVILVHLEKLKSLPQGIFFIKEITQTLGELADPRTVEPLLELLNEPYRTRFRYSPHDTKTLMTALAHIGDIRAVDPIVNILRNGHPDERQSAALALAQMNHKSIVAPLIEALEDDLPAVRFSVVEALGRVYDFSPAIREALVERAREEDHGMRGRIVQLFHDRGDMQALAALQESRQ